MSILRFLDRVEKRPQQLVNDGGVSDSIESLEDHCNVACISLYYRYYNGFCSSEIRFPVPENHIFLCNTRLSRSAQPYVVDWPVDCTLHYRQNSFFTLVSIHTVLSFLSITYFHSSKHNAIHLQRVGRNIGSYSRRKIIKGIQKLLKNIIFSLLITNINFQRLKLTFNVQNIEYDAHF